MGLVRLRTASYPYQFRIQKMAFQSTRNTIFVRDCAEVENTFNSGHCLRTEVTAVTIICINAGALRPSCGVEEEQVFVSEQMISVFSQIRIGRSAQAPLEALKVSYPIAATERKR